MAKCIECGHALNKTVGDHLYVESGLDNVVLHNVAKFHCPKCGAKSVEIPAMAQLHRMIASAIVHKPTRLEPQEVRFLRDHLALTNIEFAALMGVTASQASRWTTGDPIGTTAERFLRLVASFGPADDNERTISTGEVQNVLKHLPPQSAEATSVKIGLKRSGNSWSPTN